MNAIKSFVRLLGLGLLALGMFGGCASNETRGTVYYGVGVYDPWYYGGYYNDVDVIVPPPGKPEPPPHPAHPIAPPPSAGPRPTPLPSIPSTPRPSPRR